MLKRVLFPLLCLLVIAASGVTAQDTNVPLPPQVIDVYPIPGVELSPTDPLQIAFDQPMDRASVQAALTVEPSVEGIFAWNDSTLLTFVPQRGWVRDTRYTITIGGTAQTESGTPFGEPYSFEVQTVRPPRVTSVIPEPNSDAIAADARIVVSFDRPVAPLTTTGELADYASPIVISPPLDGVGEWINASIFSFTPSGYYAGGSDVTVTVPAGFTAADGSAVAENYVWTFTTLPPQVIATTPADNGVEAAPDEAITITFSQPMDRASVETSFQLSGAGVITPVAFEWNSAGTELTIRPLVMLALETEYNATIAQSAHGANGGSPLDSPLTIHFTTLPYPSVQQTSPYNGEMLSYDLYSARIEFNTNMNWETVRNLITVEPAWASWYPETYESDARTLWVRFDSTVPNTEYRITIRSGASDVYGNVMQSDYTFSFFTMTMGDAVYPITNGDFVMTNAYNPDTLFRLRAMGTSNVEFSLYDIDLSDAAEIRVGQYGDFVYSTYGLSGEMPPFFERLAPMRDWVERFEVGTVDSMATVTTSLNAPEGGQLAPGLYWLRVAADVGAGMNVYGASEINTYQMALAVATANITVKRTPDETFVWVTDLQSGAVVPNAAVRIVSGDEALANGMTDANGIFRAPVVLDEPELDFGVEYLAVEVTGDGIYGAWFSGSDNDLPVERGYLYTDRPIYRPGETVYYRGVVRDRRDMDFSVPDQATVHVELRQAYDSTVLWESEVNLTSFGTFSGSFTIPPDVSLGLLKLYVDFGDSVSFEYGYVSYDYEAENATSVTFRVAEFRVPEFEVQVTPQTDTIIQGDTLTAVLNASYYSGGALSDSPVTWNMFADTATFDYQGGGRWDFSPEYDYSDSFYSEALLPQGGGGAARTDDGGNNLFETVSTVAPSSTPRPMLITLEGTVIDQNGQAITGRTHVFAHVANAYVGLHTNAYVYQEDQPVRVDFIAVTPDSVAIPNVQITYEIELVRWVRIETGQFGQYDWEEQAVSMGTGATRVDADGMGGTTFTPSTPGIYRVRATIVDDQGRANTASLRFYVRGEGSVTYAPSRYGIGIIADREAYVPGDTASLFMQLPYEANWTLLITTERADVMTEDVVNVNGESVVYELPITEAFAPNVYVSVTAIKGGVGYYGDPSLPAYSMTYTPLTVTPIHRMLNVEIEPSSELYEPGDTAAFTVRVTDSDGNPVTAEVGAALTDEAVLDLAPPNSAPQLDVFYDPTRNYVMTHVGMMGLIDLLEDAYFPGGYGGGGGGDEGGGALIRDDFEYTPLWESIVTDANGIAEVSVELPDNLTTWRFDARAVTMDTDVGDMTFDVVSSLPLLIRPAAPRFFVVGDQVTLAAIVQNNTDTEQVVSTSLQAVGVQVNSAAAQSVTIPAGSRVRVTWDVVVQDVDGVDLVFSAQAASGLADAARPQLTGADGLIPVYAYTAPDTTGTGGVLRPGDAVSQVVAIPPRYFGVGGSLDVRVETSLLETAFGALEYLRTYPYASTEYTASLVIAHALTLDAESITLLSPEEQAQITEILRAGVEDLISQRNEIGGWGYFEGMDTSLSVTAYVALALIEARDRAGIDVDPDVIDAVFQIIRAVQAVPATAETTVDDLNQGTFYLYVMARAGEDILPLAQTYLDRRLELTHSSKAFLLLALMQSGAPAEMTDALVSDLLSSAVLSSTGAQWDEPRPEWRSWDSDTRSTALALLALTMARPDHDLLPNAARWLITARHGDGWETTQETVWALQALIAYGREVEGGSAEFPYEVTFNGEIVSAPDTSIPVADFAVGTLNRLTFTRGGETGLLYYTSYLSLRLPAEDITALNRGVSVRRDYYLGTNTGAATTSAQVGDTITVRLTITVPQDMYYFVLDDPLPAGVEPLDPNLLVTSEGVDDPSLRPLDHEDPFWFWNWFVFNQTEMRDSRTVLYADFLGSGTYVYSYQVRAVTPGTYQVMPAQGFAQYQPDVFGRTAGVVFSISE